MGTELSATPAASACLHASCCRQVKAVALLGALAVCGFHQSEADWRPRPHLAVLGERFIGQITARTSSLSSSFPALELSPFSCMTCVSPHPTNLFDAISNKFIEAPVMCYGTKSEKAALKELLSSWMAEGVAAFVGYANKRQGACMWECCTCCWLQTSVLGRLLWGGVTASC